jgi:hypothetical protein
MPYADREKKREWSREYARRWRAAHPERDHAWREANREKIRETNARYRAKRGPRPDTPQELERRRKPCARCGGPKPPGKRRRYCDACAPLALKEKYKRKNLRKRRYDAASLLYKALVEMDPCSYCGAPNSGVADHIVARKREGPDHWSNLTGACHACNSSKQDEGMLLFLLRQRVA